MCQNLSNMFLSFMHAKSRSRCKCFYLDLNLRITAFYLWFKFQALSPGLNGVKHLHNAPAVYHLLYHFKILYKCLKSQVDATRRKWYTQTLYAHTDYNLNQLLYKYSIEQRIHLQRCPLCQ